MDLRLLTATEALFAVGAVLMAACQVSRRGRVGSRRVDWIKFGVYFALIHVLLGAAWLGRGAACALFVCVLIGGVFEAVASRGKLPRWLPVTPPLLLAIGLGHALLAPGALWFSTFGLLLLLVASTDSFAQLCGRLWGTRYPFPRLSPNKTVQGVIGGFAAAVAVGLACGFLAPSLTNAQRVLLATATSAAATTGDLLFSAIKRRAGIKDFSGVLPGHGGILDRFDSMALAAPVYVWTRALVVG